MTSRLRVKVPETDQELEDWRHVHNRVVPTHELSLEDARDRLRRHRILVAYVGDEVVGSTTVRPPEEESDAVTVIARVLTEHRRQGFGTELYEQAMTQARELGADAVETVMLASNEDGRLFAARRGFVETERYLLPGEEVEWVVARVSRTFRNDAGGNRWAASTDG